VAIRIRIMTLVRRALVEVCTVSMLLVHSYFQLDWIHNSAFCMC